MQPVTGNNGNPALRYRYVCNGTETNLVECILEGNCTSDTDAGVSCFGMSFMPYSKGFKLIVLLSQEIAKKNTYVS